jgi:hypothetical protein
MTAENVTVTISRGTAEAIVMEHRPDVGGPIGDLIAAVVAALAGDE